MQLMCCSLASGGVQDGAFLGSVELRRREIADERVNNSVQSVDLSSGPIISLSQLMN